MKKSKYNAKSTADILASDIQTDLPVLGDLITNGETTLIFGDTNTGKSVLAVDIAIAVAYGINYFDGECDTKIEGKVLLFDLENSEAQFCRRYANSPMKNDSENRIIRIDSIELDNIEVFTQSLVSLLDNHNPKAIIFDNITVAQTKFRIPILKKLTEVSRSYGIPCLIGAHTIKRDMKKPITQNDIRGSKDVINFVDAAIAVGMSTQEANVRYIKQIKSRSTERREDVAVVDISNKDYLHFEFREWDQEAAHLGKPHEVKTEIFGPVDVQKALKLKEEGKSIREIADILGKSKSTVHRHLLYIEGEEISGKNLEDSGMQEADTIVDKKKKQKKAKKNESSSSPVDMD